MQNIKENVFLNLRKINLIYQKIPTSRYGMTSAFIILL